MHIAAFLWGGISVITTFVMISMIQVPLRNRKEKKTITLHECHMKYRYEKMITTINDGRIIRFQEEIPTQTANPSGDNK